MNQKDRLTLFHYYRSSCSWRVRWALALKGVPYQAVAVNLLTGEHTAPAHLARNPMAQVPCLVVGSELYTESVAILEWLEECFPTPALLPADPASRLRVRGLVGMIASGTQPLQNLALQRYHSSESEGQQAYARHWINKGLAAYEASLTRHGLAGTYSVGPSLTMADLCLVPQCYNAMRFGVDLQAYPQIAGIYQRALATASCQASHPDRYAPAAASR